MIKNFCYCMYFFLITGCVKQEFYPIVEEKDLYEKDLLLYWKKNNKLFSGTYVNIWDYVEIGTDDLSNVKDDDISTLPEYKLKNNFAILEIKDGKVMKWKQWRDKKLYAELNCINRHYREWNSVGKVTKGTILPIKNTLYKDSCGIK